MKKLNADRRAALGFLVAFALLTLVPLFVFDNRARLLSDSGRVTHTQEVIASLDATMLALADAESGQRGYVISGREQFLEHFQRAVQSAGDGVAKLKALTMDNPAQQKRAAELAPLIGRNLDSLAAGIDLRRQRGYGAAAAVVSGDEGRKLMNSIRNIVTDMLVEERQLLHVRKAALEATVNHGMHVFWFITGLTFAALGVCYFMVNAYLTHRRRAEEALQGAAEAAKAASLAKSAFLANMSHEIRTPMTAIVGYSDLLLEPGQTHADRADCLQTIRRNGRHLLELINDVLDLSKIEAGKMTVEQIACDVPQLAAEVTSMMRPRAIEKGLRFKLNFASTVPRKATSDPLRLKQILVNLIGNAIKFTENGGIELRVSCDLKPSTLPGSTAKVATLKFDVIDTGIGITEQQMNRLFNSFQQADDTMTRKFGGSGLGLSISQRLAKMLGGEVTAISMPLRGSTFTVTAAGGEVEAAELVDGLDESIQPAPPPSITVDLPVSSAQPGLAAGAAVGAANEVVPPAPAPIAGLLSGARVLLAEDGHDNQRLIAAHLRRAGAEVVIADNGRIAVEKITASSPPPFDVVLMDMQMPEMDGYAAAGELRRLGITLPVIALTAHAMTGDREKCIAAGCTDYLTKPVDKPNLLAAVKSYLVHPKPAEAAKPTVLKSQYAGDADMVPIIEEFVAGLPGQVAELRELIERNERTSLRRLTHQLKGSGGGYGFAAITDAAAQAERRIGEDAPLDEVGACVRELIEIVRSVEGYSAASEVAPHREAA